MVGITRLLDRVTPPATATTQLEYSVYSTRCVSIPCRRCPNDTPHAPHNVSLAVDEVGCAKTNDSNCLRSSKELLLFVFEYTNHSSTTQRQTALTAYFRSKQLLLFIIARRDVSVNVIIRTIPFQQGECEPLI